MKKVKAKKAQAPKVPQSQKSSVVIVPPGGLVFLTPDARPVLLLDSGPDGGRMALYDKHGEIKASLGVYPSGGICTVHASEGKAQAFLGVRNWGQHQGRAAYLAGTVGVAGPDGLSSIQMDALPSGGLMSAYGPQNKTPAAEVGAVGSSGQMLLSTPEGRRAVFIGAEDGDGCIITHTASGATSFVVPANRLTGEQAHAEKQAQAGTKKGSPAAGE